MSNHVSSPVDLLSDPNVSPALNAMKSTKTNVKNIKKPKARPKERTHGTKAKAKAAPTATTKPKAGDDLVVFAFRLSSEERELIHQASGPARASRFVRAVAIAAARGDLATIQAVIKESRKAAG